MFEGESPDRRCISRRWPQKIDAEVFAAAEHAGSAVKGDFRMFVQLSQVCLFPVDHPALWSFQ